ncbi:MAG: multidrug effflux MFS transporter [Pseudomonadota bacterium]
MIRPATGAPHTATLVVMTGLSILSLNMFMPSLAGMAADFEVSYALISISISGYFATTAVMQLIAGPLSDRYGRRPIVLAGFALFTVASLGCAVAPTVELFLVARILQCGVVAGAALSPAIVRDTAEPAEAAARLGMIGMAMALAPMLAPIVGGALDLAFGWRASFLAAALAGFGALLLVWRDLGETNPVLGRSLLDQVRTYPHLFGDLRFWSYAVTIAFSASTFFVFISGAPLVGTEVYGLTPAEVGLAMAVTPLGYMIGNFWTNRLSGRVPMVRLIIVGRSIALAGVLIALLLTLGDPSALLFFGLMAAVGAGNGLTIPNAYTGAMSVRPDLAGSASGVSGAITVAIGAVMTALTGMLVGAAPDRATLAALMLVSTVCAFLGGFAIRAAERPTPDLDARRAVP